MSEHGTKYRLDGDAFAFAKLVLCAVAVAMLCIWLFGCATLEPKPVAVQVKTVEVPKAVPVPCVDAADIPATTPTAMPDASADAARLAAGASADLHNLVAENAKLRALLISCTKVTP